MVPLIIKTPHQGAQTTIHCTVAEELEGVTGKFFENCHELDLAPKYVFVLDEETAERLWKVSAQMVGLEQN